MTAQESSMTLGKWRRELYERHVLPVQDLPTQAPCSRNVDFKNTGAMAKDRDGRPSVIAI